MDRSGGPTHVGSPENRSGAIPWGEDALSATGHYTFPPEPDS